MPKTIEELIEECKTKFDQRVPGMPMNDFKEARELALIEFIRHVYASACERVAELMPPDREELGNEFDLFPFKKVHSQAVSSANQMIAICRKVALDEASKAKKFGAE